MPDDPTCDGEWEQWENPRKIRRSEVQRRDGAGHHKLQPEIGQSIQRRHHNRILSGHRRCASDRRVHDLRDRAPSQWRWRKEIAVNVPGGTAKTAASCSVRMSEDL